MKKKKKKIKRKAVSKKKVLKKKPKKKVTKIRKKQAATKAKAKKRVLPPGVSLEEVGVVTHYFPHVEAAVVKLTKGSLSAGDTIVIKGHTTDFQEKVASLQLDHVPITNASIGQEIGLKVKSKVRENDAVYKMVS